MNGGGRLMPLGVKEIEWIRFARHEVGKSIYRKSARGSIMNTTDVHGQSIIDKCPYIIVSGERKGHAGLHGEIRMNFHGKTIIMIGRARTGRLISAEPLTVKREKSGIGI